jgi:hypothetical protein
MQSSLPIVSHDTRAGSDHPHRFGPVTRARLARLLLLYAGLLGFGLVLQLVPDQRARALGIGLVLPGAGFLYWGATPAALALAAGAAVLFAAALLIWFGTGNILLPPAVWLGGAVAAALARSWLGGVTEPSAALLPFGAGSLILGSLAAARRLPAPLARPVVRRGAAPAAPRPSRAPDELDPATLRLMRLILDRALQPVDAFDGFEWRDQFQTAAVRYQLNFMSYALAMAQAYHLPACRAYLATAQDNLLAKQGDHRIWRYWALENAWGRLRLAGDPVPVDNIMYSGFIAAQMRLAGNAGQSPGDLVLRDRQGERQRYSIDRLVVLLAKQYRAAEFGLLACEPNWIYPLCNMITASAIKGHDARCGTSHWALIQKRFRRGLVSEFMTPSGAFVPFRSSATGIAAPAALGGAIMQAFPCLFLNALFPDIAATQWERLRASVAKKGLRRAFWPIDVGNYGLTRASGYAAGAAAAVELGDEDLAAALLAALDRECPAITDRGVSHRPRVSLWAHAVELIARCGRGDGLRDLICEPPPEHRAGPLLSEVAYPALIVARAIAREGALHAVLYPGAGAVRSRIGIGGLRPGRFYRAPGTQTPSFRADEHGAAAIDVAVESRTELSVIPVI